MCGVCLSGWLAVGVSVWEDGCRLGVGGVYMCTVLWGVCLSVREGGCRAGGCGFLCACVVCGVSVWGGVIGEGAGGGSSRQAGGQGASPLPRTQWLG